MMPLLSAEDSETMKLSIAEKGVKLAISVLPDMTILDGHQRWTIVKFNPDFPQDIPYHIEEDLAEATEEEIIEFILVKNLERRHLTQWQKHDVYKKVKEKMIVQGKKRREANLKQGDKDPEVYERIHIGRTRKLVAEKFGISEDTQSLASAVEKTEDYETKALLDRGEISNKEAWRRVKKAQGKPEIEREKPLLYILRREDLRWQHFFVIGSAFLKWLFNISAGKDAIEMKLRFLEKKEASIIDIESDKAWKPVPFKGWACVHNVVGGCWRCFPELGEGGHQRKTSAKKAEPLDIPVGREELAGFTVLPDRDAHACHKCELWDDLNNNCKWEEGQELPEGCKKLAHRRK
ncbi:MAG: hypothetical protein GTO54_02770 [Nitrososphaeria archaeon]|nr:hypothetical protein [Nitrososphaeria archaeon]